MKRSSDRVACVNFVVPRYDLRMKPFRVTGPAGDEQPNPPASEEAERRPGYYWVEYLGTKEVMCHEVGDAKENPEGIWRRLGQVGAIEASEITFVYPGRLSEPAVRMDYSVEEAFEEETDTAAVPDRSIREACCDCGIEYPFEGVDLILPDDQWLAVFPDHGGAGVLCPNCITRRIAELPEDTRLESRLVVGPPGTYLTSLTTPEPVDDDEL